MLYYASMSLARIRYSDTPTFYWVSYFLGRLLKYMEDHDNGYKGKKIRTYQQIW